MNAIASILNSLDRCHYIPDSLPGDTTPLGSEPDMARFYVQVTSNGVDAFPDDTMSPGSGLNNAMF